MKKQESVQDEQREMWYWNEEQKETDLKHWYHANIHLSEQLK